MNSKIKTIAYEAGLYSQGTPDSWDEDALERFGIMIVKECMELGDEALQFSDWPSDVIAAHYGIER